MAMLEKSPLSVKSDLLYLRWNQVVKEQQARLSPSKEDSPVFNKHTSVFRKKSSEVIVSEEQPPETISCLISDTRHKAKQAFFVCVQNVSCAGRALRNAFLSNGQENWKAHVKLARIIKRSFIGQELVQWLTEQQCVFVGNRNAAARVWNVLLELGILLSVERLAEFEDSETLYQFSFEECEAQSCEFRNQTQWQNGVNLLLQVAPQTPLRVATPKPSEGEQKKHSLACSPVDVVQMRALERLTSKVQNELTAALARKGRCKSMIEDTVPEHSVDLPPSTRSSSEQKQGPGTGLRNREDMSRMEMVQRLAKDGCRLLHSPLKPTERPAEPLGDAAVRVCVRERSREMLLLQRTTSEQVPSSSSSSSPSSLARRYASVPASPEKVLEHLLSHLTLDEDNGSPQARETESLLDDFLLTYPVFMSTSDLCQALLGHYCLKRGRTKNEAKETLLRKRKVLHLLSQWITLCRDTLQDGEHTKVFMKMLYRYVLDDLYEFPTLENEVKELQKLLRMQRRHTVDEYSPQRKNKALFHQLSLKETWQPTRTAQRQNKEVLCHVYVTMDSYVSVRTHSEVTVQELLAAVAERLECAEDDMVLVAVNYSRGKELLQPQQCVYSDSLGAVSRLCVCRRDLPEITNLVTDNGQMQQPAVRMLSMNTWDIAVALTNCDWSFFRNLQEQELVYFTLSRDSCSGHTAALELLLQRCNEVQQWVMTEVLLCPTLCKRVQLFKKFIKIAAHCKAQRNLNSFFAIIMGLNTPAVSRLTQTWEKVPGKFKKLFSELESLTDPSFNHKAYRDAFKKMKCPKIPFLPLLLKDITFIHEGNKTFLDNLVNFEKLHMMADMVRVIRHCQTDHMGHMLTQKESPDVKAYINYLHIIDNQQTLFELSHRLETKV
ncbi:rap guanine nucleotide exchange factor 5b isoform X1 [Hemibagrus wyckioides]|uniref:rap guanine nucleotide exchange factor 5b isoform X1 n=1 Tax=Hemibagrus wyckioides TaxID=337641 RepID=UPI00266C1863|nr:rap guanine nucleotide exchange factor 5b isoform X1 [Hemibagrus wyckioides]